MHITKTWLYNFDLFKPHFYIVKLGLQGYTLFFLLLLKNIECGYSLEPPRGLSLESLRGISSISTSNLVRIRSAESVKNPE